MPLSRHSAPCPRAERASCSPRWPSCRSRVHAEEAWKTMPESPAAATLPEMATREEERELIHEVADAVGALMEFWGFKRVMGRLWTVLYLSGEPLTAAELCERLAISSGA